MTTTGAPATGSRRGRTSTSPDRMPVPTRQRRPGLAALALVLILGGGALSGYLVLHSSHKRSVVFATHQIKAGQQIQPGDLTDGQISATLKRGVDFRPVLYGDVGSLTGQYATTTIPAGAIVSKDMYASTQPGGQCAEVALSVAQGSYPPGQVSPGDLVKIVAVPKASGSDSGSAAPPKPTLVARIAYVTGIRSSAIGSGGGVVISVLAPSTSDAGSAADTDLAIAAANAQNGIQVIRLPRETDPTSFIQTCTKQ